MSDCGEPCDACGNRGTHHLCDTCCEEEAKALEAKLHEVQAVLTEDVRLDQWEKCGIIDSAFIANLRQARRERDEAQACLAFERVTVAELKLEVARLNKGLRDIRDQLYEAECDCPPEWPRCSYCKTRLRIQVLLRKDEP